MEDRAAPEDTDALARDHRRIVRLHLAAWGVLLLITAVSAAVLGTELWTPDPTHPVAFHTRVAETHGVAGAAAALGPAAGIAGMIVLPARLQRPGFRWQWLGYVGLAVSLGGAVLLLFGTGPHVPGFPGNFWGIAGLVGGLACLAAMIVVELATNRARWGDAPLLVVGVGLGALLQLLAFGRSSLEAIGPRLGVPTLGSGLPYLLPLTFPVVLGIAGDMLERVGGRVPPRALTMLPIVAFGLMPWLPDHWSMWLPALVAVPSTGIGVIVWWLAGTARRDPRTLAVSFAVVLTAIACAIALLLLTATVDTHLHDTYHVTAYVHLRGAAALLVVLALLFDRPELGLGRDPHLRLGAIGLVVLALGLGTAFVTQLLLGAGGMPRRYHTYIERFATHFQISIAAAVVAGIGLLLVTLALWGRPFARSDASQGT